MDKPTTKHKFPVLKMWQAALLAFVLLTGAIVFTYFSRGDFIRDDIHLIIDAPASIEGGSTTPIEVALYNGSTSVIEDIRIAIHLPEELVFDDGMRLKSATIDSLHPGREHRIATNISAISTDKTVKVEARADYSPQDINVRYSTKESENIIIGSLDAEVEIDIPKEVYIQEKLEGVIRITPRSSLDKASLYARIIAPEEFEIEHSMPDFDRELAWRLDDVQRGEKKDLNFTGTWKGDSNSFSLTVEVGHYRGLDFLPLFATQQAVRVTSSPLLVEVAKRGNSKNVKSGSEVVLDIIVKNKGDVDMSNVVVNAVLPEEFVDIQTATGGYGSQKNNNEISWGYLTMNTFRVLPQQQEVRAILSFSVRDFERLASDQRKDFLIEVEARASLEKRGELRQTAQQELSLTGNPQFSQRVTHSSQYFPANGPIPPVVGEETSFVVYWRIHNSLSALNNVKVIARLPDNVDFGGSVYPVRQDSLFYDEEKKEVVWELDTLDPFFYDEISFAVWVIPRSEHEGNLVQILQPTSFRALDAEAKDVIEQVLPSVDSSLPDDENISRTDGIVTF